MAPCEILQVNLLVLTSCFICFGRLERNVYPEFSPEPRGAHMSAELSKLSEPVLSRIYNFLQAADFSRATQANKVRGIFAPFSSSVRWTHFFTCVSSLSLYICAS